MTRPDRSAGHLIVAQLEREGVERAYCVPGESYLDVLDGLHDSSIDDDRHAPRGRRRLHGARRGPPHRTGRRRARHPRPGRRERVHRGAHRPPGRDPAASCSSVSSPSPTAAGSRSRSSTSPAGSAAPRSSSSRSTTPRRRPASSRMRARRRERPSWPGRHRPSRGCHPALGGRAPTSSTPRAAAAPEPSASALLELDERLERAERPVVIVGGEGWTAETGRALTDWADGAGRAGRGRLPRLGRGAARQRGLRRRARVRRATDALAALVDEADLVVQVGCPRTDVLSDGYRSASAPRRSSS